MTMENAALWGMGLITLWGVVALLLAIKSAKSDHHVDAGAVHSH